MIHFRGINATAYETQIGNTDRRRAQMRSSLIQKNEMCPHQRGSELARWRVKGDDILFSASQLS
jgi:hypothetical protein